MHVITSHRVFTAFATRTWASYQIRKIAGCACAGNAGNVFPRRRFRRKPLFSDPGMHHGTCVTHVPWCMSGSLTCGDGENVPGIPGACAPAILRIWQEAHASLVGQNTYLSAKLTSSAIMRSVVIWCRFSFLSSLFKSDSQSAFLAFRGVINCPLEFRYFMMKLIWTMSNLWPGIFS